MSAPIYEALLACDEQRYTLNGNIRGAVDTLRVVVERDPDEARRMLGNLQGCRRTVARHTAYLKQVLEPPR
jgi:hypothetical protein